MASLGDLVIKVGGNIDGFRDAMREGVGLTEGFGEKIGELGLEIVGITSVFEGLKEAVEISAQIETATVALAVFTGSAEKAAVALETIEEIAQSSALSLTEAIPAAQHMLALGYSIETTAATMKAAADAAWALGLPVEDISQRIAQIGMSGMVSERQLRTMGLSLSELGRVMGIGKDDVKAAMEGMDEATRVAVMDMAIEQSKMAGTAEKEAQTIAGQWTTFKNTFHGIFKEIGDDLKEITGFFLRFGTTTAQVLADLFSNLPGVDPLKGMIDVVGSGLKSLKERGDLSGTKSFAEVSAEQHAAATAPKLGEKGRFSGPVAESETAPDIHAAALEALREKQAKEAAGPALVANTNADQEAVRAADRARKIAEQQIEEKHSAIVAENNLIRDGFKRAQATSAEEIRLAEERKTRLGAIDQQEHDDRLKLLQQRESIEKAAKFEKDPAINREKELTVHAEVTGKIAALDGKLAEQRIALDANVSKATGKSNEDESNHLRQLAEDVTRFAQKIDEANRKLSREHFIEQNAPGAFSILAKQASDEVLAKGKGQTDAEAVQLRKLELERSYGQEVFHTFAQQIAYETQIAALDAEARNAKIAGLQQQLELTAAAMKDASAGSEQQVSDAKRVAELFNQISVARAEANNADFAAQTKLGLEKQRHQLPFEIETDFKHAAEQLPGALGNSLAKGVLSGKNIGKEIANSLKSIGQQLFGQLITQAIEKMIAELIVNTAIGAWLGTVFGTSASAQVAASAANTAALHANTLAQLKSGASGIAGGASGAAGSAAGAASSVATGFAGPLIAAAGGIIGGFISGIFSLIGDNRIVKAVNGTTAAVLSLRGTAIGGGGGNALTTKDAQNQSQSGGGSGVGGFLQGLFGLGNSQAIPVRIVQSWGDILHQGLFGALGAIFGFAGGGVPPLGVPSIVGESGPELFIPHQLGTIIPNDQLRGFNARGGNNLIQSSTGHTFNGDLHFHGVQDVRGMMRAIASTAKTASPVFSPFAR